MIEEMITDNTYEKENPEINDLNVFSVSTLAFDWLEQVKKKFDHRRVFYPTEADMTMFYGKAAHEWIQARFVRKGWIAEKKIVNELRTEPITINGKTYDTIKIIGHVDLFDPINKVVIEIKTTSTRHEIMPYHIIQAGYYAYELSSTAFVVLLNHSRVIVQELNDLDIVNAKVEIEKRANLAWKQILTNLRLWSGDNA